MKKVTLSQILILPLFLVMLSEVQGQTQSEAILVPAYQNRSEMSEKMKPEQKLLRQLPKVVINENGINSKLFQSQMNEWVQKNPKLLSQLEQSVIELIQKKQYEELAQQLLDMNHSIEVVAIKSEGGKHE